MSPQCSAMPKLKTSVELASTGRQQRACQTNNRQFASRTARLAARASTPETVALERHHVAHALTVLRVLQAIRQDDVHLATTVLLGSSPKVLGQRLAVHALRDGSKKVLTSHSAYRVVLAGMVQTLVPQSVTTVR